MPREVQSWILESAAYNVLLFHYFWQESVTHFSAWDTCRLLENDLLVCSVTGGGGGGGMHSPGLVSERPFGEAGRDAFEERQSFCLDVQANLHQAVQNQGKTESLLCI